LLRPAASLGQTSLSQGQFRLEGPGDFQYGRILGIQSIGHHRRADLTGIMISAAGLMDESKGKSAVSEV
jgi:hypothetical protein